MQQRRPDGQTLTHGEDPYGEAAHTGASKRYTLAFRDK